MAEFPLPPGLQWAPPGAPAPGQPAAPPEIPVLPPGMQWKPPEVTAPMSVHPSEQMPQMPGSTGATGIERFFTAEGRAIDPATKQPYREIRELATMLPQSSWAPGDQKGVSAMMMFEPDEANRAEWIAKKFPNAKVRREGREIIIDIPDVDPKTGRPIGAFTMNRVGMSAQDADDIVRELTLMGPAARAAGWGSSLIRRALAGGAAAGVTEGARQGISAIAGSRKNVSLPDVAMATGAGAVLGGLSEAAFGLLRRAFATNALVNVNGQMTSRGRLILERAGLDPDQVTLQTLRELEPLMARARTPEEALRLAQARSLDVPVTRGDITRDPKMQAVEQRSARGGTYGTAVMPSERRLFDLKRPGGAQDEALADALRETSRRVTGRPTEFNAATGEASTRQGSTFARTQEVLVRLHERMRANVRRHYETAEAGNVAMMPNKVSPLSRELQLIKESTNVPQAHSIADEVAAEIKQAIAGGATPIQLNRMNLIRQKISELGASSDPMVRQVGARLRRAYDGWERNLVPDSGDPAAIASFARGRELRTRQGAMFDDDPVIAAILRNERMPSATPGGKPTYKIDINPSEAVDMILGSGLGKRGAADSALRLRNVLGPNSQAWQDFKREVFQRISEKGVGHFERRWETFLRDSPELADVVFPAGDRAHMGTMAGLANTTRPVPGAVNHSGTAYEIARQMPISNMGAALVGRAATGTTPANAMRPLVDRALPFPLRAAAMTAAAQQDAPDAQTVARFLRSQLATPGQQ